MVRLPHTLRSCKRLADKAADSKNPECSLSVDSDFASDKPKMDSSIEDCLSQLLTKDDFFEKITTKLAGKLQTVVQRVAATALETVLDQVYASRRRCCRCRRR